jgi:hypothetical protein
MAGVNVIRRAMIFSLLGACGRPSKCNRIGSAKGISAALGQATSFAVKNTLRHVARIAGSPLGRLGAT